MPVQGAKKPSEQQDPYSNDPRHDNPPREHRGRDQTGRIGHESQKGPGNKQGHHSRKHDQRQPNKH
jgi:hypothetical protein